MAGSLRIFFVLPLDRACHSTEALAFGLAAEGHRCVANVDGARSFGAAGAALFAVDERPDFAAFDLVVIDATGLEHWDERQMSLFHAAMSVRTGNQAIVSDSDENNTTAYPDSVPAFLLHESRDIVLGGHRIPWACGLVQRTVERTAAAGPLAGRERVVLRSFRPAGHQSVRDALDLVLLPMLERRWPVDRRMHGTGIYADAFYDRLLGAQACLAYCGTFLPRVIDNPYFAEKLGPHVLPGLKQPVAIARWDSLRFWESLAAGCLTVALDLDRYGFRMPVAPRNWEHYVGLDMGNLEHDLDRLAREEPRWPEIAAAGRRWVLDHYAPRAAAARFLATLRALDRLKPG